jgi:hypothetical protein
LKQNGGRKNNKCLRLVNLKYRRRRHIEKMAGLKITIIKVIKFKNTTVGAILKKWLQTPRNLVKFQSAEVIDPSPQGMFTYVRHVCKFIALAIIKGFRLRIINK